MEQRKILIIGAGTTPTDRFHRTLMDLAPSLNLDIEYRQFNAEIVGESTHSILVDTDFSALELKVAGLEELFRFGPNDFNGIERRIDNAIVYGTSHPEMYWPDERVLDVPADKRKGPKGPRTKWGKLK